MDVIVKREIIPQICGNERGATRVAAAGRPLMGGGERGPLAGRPGLRLLGTIGWVFSFVLLRLCY